LLIVKKFRNDSFIIFWPRAKKAIPPVLIGLNFHITDPKGHGQGTIFFSVDTKELT